jgi:hypothetical protein
VKHGKNSDALIAKVRDDFDCSFSVLWVECRNWFVKKQQTWGRYQTGSNIDALLFSTRQD